MIPALGGRQKRKQNKIGRIANLSVLLSCEVFLKNVIYKCLQKNDWLHVCSGSWSNRLLNKVGEVK